MAVIAFQSTRLHKEGTTLAKLPISDPSITVSIHAPSQGRHDQSVVTKASLLCRCFNPRAFTRKARPTRTDLPARVGPLFQSTRLHKEGTTNTFGPGPAIPRCMFQSTRLHKEGTTTWPRISGSTVRLFQSTRLHKEGTTSSFSWTRSAPSLFQSTRLHKEGTTATD